MGNKLGRRRQVVDERYTKPQGLYVHKDVDHKKLRKLILESKLAPCFPGDEDSCCDHEECPICFLYYPSLNRSRCCKKGICTECFLQMKNPNSTRPTQCPFCKTSNYAVEYRGVKTKEEKGLEQIEEQRVIEAKIRMRQQELQEDEERIHKRLDVSSSSANIEPGELECGPTAGTLSLKFCYPLPACLCYGYCDSYTFYSPLQSSFPVPSDTAPVESGETVSSQYSIRRPPHAGANRDAEFDLDLEDIMVMEAIWLSIQEKRRQKNPLWGDATQPAQPAQPAQYTMEARHATPAMAPLAGSSSSPSGGLACAIAALAERQQTGGETIVHNSGNMPSFNLLPSTSSFYNRLEQDADNYLPTQSSSNVLPDCRMIASRDDGEWGADRGSDAAEAGTSYASSESAEDAGGISSILPPPPPPDEIGGSFQNVSGPIPESFEEQMMLAMAVSLAEARAMASEPQSAWQ
ncbi:hypothetical protein SADUNF_Sadunf16G0248100 [Salix dunnii]|uniref:RING-type domain-containing protein n=1 Tax=Salix dunnii TaxID=1413687 RepID=A0A835JDL8_9ROSI|nr:hypothetical protein SADUNF_Sadunf16G0248100 [Salix dunnii]